MQHEAVHVQGQCRLEYAACAGGGDSALMEGHQRKGDDAQGLCLGIGQHTGAARWHSHRATCSMKLMRSTCAAHAGSVQASMLAANRLSQRSASKGRPAWVIGSTNVLCTGARTALV